MSKRDSDNAGIACPAATAIREIKGSADFAEMGKERFVKLGGVDYNVNETVFYAMSRKLELARFQLTNPDTRAVDEKRREFRRTFVEIYESVINFDLLFRAFELAQESAATLLKYISQLLLTISRRNPHGEIGLTIPDFYLELDSDIRRDPIRGPQEWHNKTAKFIGDLMRLNIASISAVRICAQDLIDEPRVDGAPVIRLPPAGIDKALLNADNDAPTLAEMFEHEMRMIKKITEIEEYYFYILRRLAAAISCVDKLISALAGEISLSS